MPQKINFTTEQVKDFVLRYEAGESFRDISKVYGVCANTIRNVAVSAGVKPDAGRMISAKMIGKPSHRKGAKWSEETRKKFYESRSKKPWGGRVGPHKPETLIKISESLKARRILVEQSFNISAHTKTNRKSGPPPYLSAEEKKLRESVRQACKRFLRRVLLATGKWKTTPTQKALGYSTCELLAHLGPKPDNAHIDHYVPIVEFIKRGITDPAAINALCNLRWLNGRDNQRKNDWVPPDADEVINSCLKHSYSRGIA